MLIDKDRPSAYIWVMRYFALVMILVSAWLVLGKTALAQQTTCRAPQADVSFDSQFEPAILNHSLSKAAIQRLGGNVNVFGRGSIIGGLYRPEHDYRLNLRQTLSQGRRINCVVTVQATFVYRLRQTIFIPRDYAKRSCQFNAVYSHEIQHSDFEETSFKLFKPRFEQAIRRTIARYGHRPLNQLQSRMENAIREVHRVFDADRSRRHATIDNPQNYARESRRCSSW